MTSPTTARLGDLTEPVVSWNPTRSPDEQFDYIDLSSVDQSSKLVSGATRLLARDAPSRARQLVSPGDVLVSTVRPNLNGVAVVPETLENATASTGFTVLRPGSGLEGRYLFHWVRSPHFIDDMVRSATGASYPAVSDRIVKASLIPLPPLDEQRRIAAILDKADGLRAKRRRALAHLDDLTQSIFLDMFAHSDGTTYQRMALPDVYWFQEGPGVRKWQFRTTGIKLLNVSNILRSGHLDLSQTDKFLAPDETVSRYSHFLVDEGDLVVASSGISFDTDGLLRTRGAFVGPQHLPLCMNTSTIRFKAVSSVSTLPFLKTWLQSYEFRSQISKLVTGTAQQNFGPSHLRSLTITLPPHDEQQRFSDRCLVLDETRDVHQDQLDKLDSLFASLQSRAFAGEL